MMKKLFALLLTLTLAFALVSCDLSALNDLLDNLSNIPDFEGITDFSEGEEDEGSDSSAPVGGSEIKIDESKTLELYRRVIAGDYTLKYTSFPKKLDGSGEFENTNGTENVRAYYGESIYKYQASSLLGDSKKIIDGEFIYGIFDDSQMVIKEKYRPSHEKNSDIATFGDGEDDYYNMVGDPKQVEVWGKTYYCEHFSFDAESIDYLYEGDELKFIIVELGGTYGLLRIDSLTPGADSELFEIPESYTVYG